MGSAYAAQMKGVLLQRLSAGRVVDVAHDLPAHGIAEAAFVVAHVAATFPPGTVHLVVVDPGVGGSRAPIVIACRDGSFLVGPDNGVLAPLAAKLGRPRAYRLDPNRVVPGRTVSATFEGRDLFAPAAARLATGARAAQLGPPVPYRHYEIPRAVRRGRSVEGEVVHVDRFGNLITNVPSTWLSTVPGSVTARWRRRSTVLPRRRTYAELAPRQVGLLGSSFATIEIGVREGSAAARTRLGVGERVAFTADLP